MNTKKEGTPMSGAATLDKAIEESKRWKLFEASTEGLHTDIKKQCGETCTRIGNLVFKSDRHNTGCDVSVWVVDGPDALKVRSTTYWYSSSYTFNEAHNVYGPWDAAIADSTKIMIEAASAQQEVFNARIQEANDSVAAKRSEVVSRFAASFTQPQG